MYLTANDNTEILLRTIHDLAQLVEAGKLQGDSAFVVIAKTAEHHPEHPKKEKERAANRKKAVSEATGQDPETVPDIVDAL